ncbi:MAG: 50S ribosomal protein L4 [Kiritimatiellae bacterium]|nr:50S ribosomal protein L4 [Kiritimatiellia bacterium]
MSTIPVFSAAGEAAGEVSVDESKLTLDRGEQAVKDTIVAIQAGKRAGCASTLSKGEVAGSNKKPWKQKGTGRARAGFRQSPVWRGGGVAFGPKPRDYSQKINIKVKQLAFNRVVSDMINEGRVKIIEQFDLAEPKTKALIALLKKIGTEPKGVLILSDRLDEKDRNLLLSASNLQKVEVAQAVDVDLYTLMLYRTWVVTRAGYEAILARMAKLAPKRAQKKEVEA